MVSGTQLRRSGSVSGNEPGMLMVMLHDICDDQLQFV